MASGRTGYSRVEECRGGRARKPSRENGRKVLKPLLVLSDNRCQDRPLDPIRVASACEVVWQIPVLSPFDVPF